MADLWIRNQSKSRLVKVNDLTYHIEGDFWGIYANKECDYIGLYETEERALEVLDEIQKLLITGDTLLLKNFSSLHKEDVEYLENKLKINIVPIINPDDPNVKIEYLNKSCIVYEMPKE